MDTKARASEAPFISIVDDDASIRSSTRRLIRSVRMRAEAFASAEDFLNSGHLLETACLILDVRMPGMDGLELQRRLAEIEQRIPVIFLSARATDEEERRALQSGAVGFLRKPVGKEALLNAIRTALESRR